MTVPPETVPPEIRAVNAIAARSFAAMDHNISRLQRIARNLRSGRPVPRSGGPVFPAKLVTRLSYEAEADVHRAARAQNLTVPEFCRRALAAAVAGDSGQRSGVRTGGPGA